MSVAEKLAAMELFWTDLARRAPDEVIPGWHNQVLAEREKSLATGQEAVIDWEDAKAKLRREIDESKNT